MSHLSTIRIAFIGAGNMASAMIGGLVNNGLQPSQLKAADPIAESRSKIEKLTGVATSANNLEVIADANVVILAVKPQQMKTVCQGISATISNRQPLVISIAAGITVEQLERWLGANKQAPAIVRCMPNTPALINSGATGMYANSATSTEQRSLARQILESTGIVCEVGNETQLDAVTALSGSGPAYFFFVMEAMKAAGIQLGLEEKTAGELTLQTALGAARMACESDVSPAELRRRVTSPGGTTEAAIRTFEENHLREIFASAMKAADSRSKTLSREME